MKNQKASRRQFISQTSMASAALLLSSCSAPSKSIKTQFNGDPFSYCLNTSTIMGQKLGLEKEIDIAASAGYDGIEIWIPTLKTFLDQGGKLSELKKKIDDLGISVENAIGFAQWIVDDASVRSDALNQAATEMSLLAQLGCRRIAAPPAGATEADQLDLDAVAERFSNLIDVGIQEGVVPQLEVWGFSKHLHKLSQVVYVATECGRSETKILPDAYHLYKGGSDFDGLKLIAKDRIDIFHINDYPAQPPRADISDKDRVFPGLGIAPLKQILTDIYSDENQIVLSLELFNRDYWNQDALTVAKDGLKHMKQSVKQISI